MMVVKKVDHWALYLAEQKVELLDNLLVDCWVGQKDSTRAVHWAGL